MVATNDGDCDDCDDEDDDNDDEHVLFPPFLPHTPIYPSPIQTKNKNSVEPKDDATTPESDTGQCVLQGEELSPRRRLLDHAFFR